MLSAKYASLLAGVFQQAFIILLIRYSKSFHRGSGPAYLNSVAVAASEVFKMCLAFASEAIAARGARGRNSADGGWTTAHDVRKMTKDMLICNTERFGESAKLVVPAILYLVQNNLTFVALTNLNVGLYQVSNQGKLLTTALLSRIMLRKRISAMQYLSIALLGFGVAFIHLSEHNVGTTRMEMAPEGLNQMLGFMAVFTCCFTSSFAGVYFEYVLKKSPIQLSVNCRNVHLASWSLVFATLQILFNDWEHVSKYGLFGGFDALMVLVVMAQGTMGFVHSMIIKHADNVLKGFALAVAAVVSTLLSVPLFGADISPNFGLGAAMVVLAVRGYSKYPPVKGEEATSMAKEVPTGIEKDEEGETLMEPEGSPSKQPH